MNDRDLDRIIDTATADIIRRKQPSRTLRHDVLARVREPNAPAPRRHVWATAAAIAVVCAAIAVALMNRAAPTRIGEGSVRLKPDATTPVELKTDTKAGNAADSANDKVGGTRLQSDVERMSRRPGAIAVTRRLAAVTFPPNDLPFSIEPIAAAPLELPSIGVTPLEQQAASVEGLEIEQITIEPLTASND
jgi:hypothetical protein